MCKYFLKINLRTCRNKLSFLILIPIIFIVMDFNSCITLNATKNDFFLTSLGGIGNDLNMLSLFKSLIFILVQVLLADICRENIVNQELMLINRLHYKLKVSVMKIFSITIQSLLYNGLILTIIYILSVKMLGDINNNSLINSLIFLTGMLINSYLLTILCSLNKNSISSLTIYSLILVVTSTLFLASKIPIYLSLASYGDIIVRHTANDLFFNIIILLLELAIIFILDSINYRKGV